MLGGEDCPFATARWTQVEALTREGPNTVVPAFGVGTADARDAPEIVATRRKALPDLLDQLKAVPAAGGGVLLIVLCAEVIEVPFEYGMELVAAAGNVPIPRRGRDRDCRAHIIIYGSNELPASRGSRIHGTPHNTSSCQEGMTR